MKLEDNKITFILIYYMKNIKKLSKKKNIY
jgi:hypothetical protein